MLSTAVACGDGSEPNVSVARMDDPEQPARTGLTERHSPDGPRDHAFHSHHTRHLPSPGARIDGQRGHHRSWGRGHRGHARCGAGRYRALVGPRPRSRRCPAHRRWPQRAHTRRDRARLQDRPARAQHAAACAGQQRLQLQLETATVQRGGTREPRRLAVVSPQRAGRVVALWGWHLPGRRAWRLDHG